MQDKSMHTLITMQHDMHDGESCANMAAKLKPSSGNIAGSMTMQVFAYHISGNPAHIMFPCLPSTTQLKVVVSIWCSSLLQ